MPELSTDSFTSLKELSIWRKIRSQSVLKKYANWESSMVHNIGMLWNIGNEIGTAANSKKLS